LVRRSSALFVVRRYLKRSIGFEEKTLNPSLLKDLEFKRLNERSFKSIVKRLYIKHINIKAFENKETLSSCRSFPPPFRPLPSSRLLLGSGRRASEA
jgi:hypothetical protein